MIELDDQNETKDKGEDFITKQAVISKIFTKAIDTLAPEVYRGCKDLGVCICGSRLLNSTNMIIIFDFMGRMHYITGDEK